MTARPVGDGDGQDGLREELIRHRMVAGSHRGVVCRCGWEGPGSEYEAHAADALLLVVTTYARIARAEGAAGALNAAVHEVDDDDAAELLAHRAIQWEREAAALAADDRTGQA